jgi:hypothetical protein
MNCLRCNAPNELGAKFCRNCGAELGFAPISQIKTHIQTINQLLFLTGIEYFRFLGWFILQKAIVPIFFTKGDVVEWDIVNPIYKYFGWFTDAMSLIAVLVFAIIVKNQNAKTFLIIVLILKIIFLIGYRVFDET